MLLVAALGYEAVTAARGQREAAEGVLRDYARLATDQYARNASITLDYEWFFPVLTLAAGGPGTPFPDPDTEIEAQRGTYRLGDLATRFFWIDLETGKLVTAGPETPGYESGDKALEETVAHDARTRYREGWSSAAIFDEDAGSRRVLVYRVVGRTADHPGVVHGFEGVYGVVNGFLASALGLYALLPESLTEGVEDDGLVSISVTDAVGRTLFKSGATYELAVSTQADLGPRFAGLHVEASISPESASRLVVGGLPRSRLPLIAGMFGITVALLVAGVALLRREQELVDLREQFVAGASHELRTPLAQIRMFAETLRLDRIRSDEERRRYLTTLDREARRLTFLVDNLLQFSRSGQRAKSFAPALADVGRLTADIVEDLEPLAAARGARIGVEVGERTDAPIDRDMLRQVLLNLLDNAIKYGPEGQTVAVTVADADGDVVVSVTDQGPGVPAPERTRIWERFWRGQAANGIGGSGIGLALVKELVELHGGEVSIEAPPAGGARFVVRLPGARPS